MTATTTDEKRDTLPADARERLDAAVRAMATDDGFRRWLDTRAKFHRYSFNNTLLIAIQRPDATQVMGYGDRCPRDGSHGFPCERPEAHKSGWLSVGRHVRAGEHGIKILAPKIGYVDADGRRVGWREAKNRSDLRKVVYGFKVVTVFDVAQTDGESLGTPPNVLPLDGDAPDDADAMLGAVLDAEGLTFDVADLPRGLAGFLDSKKRRLVIASGQPGAERLSTIAHELGHHFDPEYDDASYHTDREVRGDSEAVAEAVAYIVCAAFGVDAGPSAVGYVSTWAKGDPEVVHRLAERIDAAASAILGDKRKEVKHA